MAGEWYQQGTVSVTNGSAVVTGSGGTLFVSQVTAGDMFTVDRSRFYEVLSVDSDTQITLTENYAGSSDATASYAIVRLFGNSLNAVIASRITDLLAKWLLREKEQIDWFSGTIDGGENGDGYYPITDFEGNTTMVLSAAALLDQIDQGIDELTDDDLDTYLRVEQNADEDKIRGATGGVERFVISSTGAAFAGQVSGSNILATAGAVKAAAGWLATEGGYGVQLSGAAAALYGTIQPSSAFSGSMILYARDGTWDNWKRLILGQDGTLTWNEKNVAYEGMSPEFNVFVGAKGDAPYVRLRETNGAVNENYWRFVASAGLLDFRAYSDDEASYSQAMRFWRDGTDIANIYFYTDNAQLAFAIAQNGDVSVPRGDLTVSGDVRADGTYYYGDNKPIVQYSDTLLRLNPTGAFSGGIHANGVLRVADSKIFSDQSSAVADDEIYTFNNIPLYPGMYLLIATGASTSVNIQALFFCGSSQQHNIGSGSNVVFGGTTDPDQAGKINIYIDYAAGSKLAVHNRYADDLIFTLTQLYSA